MTRRLLLCGVLLLAVGCGDADELDLGDLSDRTVPADNADDADELDLGDSSDRTVPADDADELDLGDLSDRTVPADDADGAAPLRREDGGFVDTCSVLTEAEVARATGLVVTGAEEEPGFGCSWQVENIDPSIIADDAITFRPFPAAQFTAQRSAIEQGLAGERIPGLGDDAYYVGTETLGAVWVLLGDISFEVGNQFAFSDVEGRPYQEALAAAIVDALA